MRKKNKQAYLASLERFRNRLLELIASKDCSQKSLAEDIGITASALSQYASGRTFPTVYNLMIVAKYFGVTTDWILGIEVDEE